MSQAAVGIDLGGTKIEAMLLVNGVEGGRVRVATPRDDYPGTLDALVHLVLTLEREAGEAVRVGAGIPGSIEPSTGLVKNANSRWLIGRPLQSDLEARLARRVVVANDANCFALSEAADGAGAGADVVFGVILGTGVGGGVAVGGRVRAGANGVSGEWGHNPLPWMQPDETPGPPCYCGQRGCIETFLSGPALAEDHHAATGERLQAAAIADRAASGDESARHTMARYEHRAARALAAVINVLDPDVIVLGGGVSNIERLYAGIRDRWAAFVFGCDRSGADAEAMERRRAEVRTKLRRAVHGDASGVRGAAWLAVEADAIDSRPDGTLAPRQGRNRGFVIE